jgi:prevent-host-death family protein
MKKPRTKTVKASEARRNWSQLLNSVFRGESRVVVEKSGIPVAGIVSASDLERLVKLDEDRERDFIVLDELGQAFADVPDEQLEAEIKRALELVRLDRRKGFSS